MDRQDGLDKLLAARSAHVRWLARAQALVAGVPLDDEQVPVTVTDCEFGQWYYGPGQGLSALASFRAIEAPHQQLHRIYTQIFAHLHGDASRSLAGRLLGSKKQTKQQRVEAAQELLPEMNSASETLLAAVTVLEAELRTMAESD